MHIRIVSDLHLEQFYHERPGWPVTTSQELANIFLRRDERDSEAVLVLAGDISSKPDQLIAFIEHVAPRFIDVVYVPGNHEFYKHDMHEWAKHVDVRLTVQRAPLEVRCCIIRDVRFIFGILWGDGGSPLNHMLVQQGLADFYLIRYKGRQFTVHDMIELHKQQKQQIKQELLLPAAKTVVVTHHMPSYRLCHPRFGTELNGGFAANCDDILAYDHAPDVWIHGHTHDTIDTQLWSTRIVCNPAGYIGEGLGYNTFGVKFIEV